MHSRTSTIGSCFLIAPTLRLLLTCRMIPQACLFDIGNVLVTFDYARTFPMLAARTPRTFAEVLDHLSAMSGVLETGRLSSEEFIARALDFLGSGVTRAEFLASFEGIFELIEPVWELMKTIRRRVPVYLFSNTSELHEACLFRLFPQFAGFDGFDGGFYSWRLGTMKPEPGMYEAALSTLGLRPEEIAYVDDLPANIATGRRLGSKRRGPPRRPAPPARSPTEKQSGGGPGCGDDRGHERRPRRRA